ncbi:conserved hypothetical protein [Theileria orientalis strain Shintoku]|uniref:Uncharacterized protein n=1 Tax=Theileria orientalis strain Shintoku TaxID=869250 RepID=J4D5M4_THEOR|nr:conserved hypothetical protein [Theileria orientalis strain Shintoku]PVC54080.1 hypothetical protein MACL_00003320 [Theileria orientalis]BAM39055.1 conserved hypothetical protein [Theileria orientalis strain Shintoku]|eukprot:XP_009689356.1 conserved hypothetical protein [Theileria orientalis strain Shintoku]
MTKLTGFTEAELAAFEWSKRQNELDKSSKSDAHRIEKPSKRRRSYSSDTNSSLSDYSGSPRSKDSHSVSPERPPPSTHRNSDTRSSGHKIKFRGSKDNNRPIISSSSSSSLSPGRRHTKSHSMRASDKHSRKHHKYIRKRHRRAGRSRSRSYSRTSVGSRSSAESRSSNDLPRDPFNPLNLAYRSGHHGSSRKRSNGSRGRSISDKGCSTSDRHESKDEDRWKHDLYESDSERVSYEAQIKKNRLLSKTPSLYNKSEQGAGKTPSKRAEDSDSDSGTSSRGGSRSRPKQKLITKRGWKSRAGGVYIPGDEDEDLYYDRRKSGSYERPDPSYTLD